MSKRMSYITELVTTGRKDGQVNIPLMVNFKDIYADVMPATHKEEEMEDGTVKLTDVIYQLSVIKSVGSQTYDSYFVTALEHIVHVNSAGTFITEPIYNSYCLVTKHEEHLMKEKEEYSDDSVAIPKYLLDVKMPSEYPYQISQTYSHILEDYLSQGGFKIQNFLDFVIPVVEAGRPTILKASVYWYISSTPDWVNKLCDNINLLPNEELKSKYIVGADVGAEQYTRTAIQDTREAINNYMNVVANVFGILSAHKRGKDIVTTELIRSCPEFTSEENLLIRAVGELRISELSELLPLFSADFMRKFMMGNVPLFLISDKSEAEQTYFGCDIFKDYKEALIQGMQIALKEVSMSSTGEVKSLLTQLTSAITQTQMPGMYMNYIKTSRGQGMKLRNMLESSYQCYFVDYIVYSEVLKTYKNQSTNQYTLFDFLNLVSPVVLTRKELV